MLMCVLCCDVQIQWRVGDGARSSGRRSVQIPAGALLPASFGKTDSVVCVALNPKKTVQPVCKQSPIPTE